MYNSKLLTEKKAALDWTQLSSGIISQERRQRICISTSTIKRKELSRNFLCLSVVCSVLRPQIRTCNFFFSDLHHSLCRCTWFIPFVWFCEWADIYILIFMVLVYSSWNIGLVFYIYIFLFPFSQQFICVLINLLFVLYILPLFWFTHKRGSIGTSCPASSRGFAIVASVCMSSDSWGWLWKWHCWYISDMIMGLIPSPYNQ